MQTLSAGEAIGLAFTHTRKVLTTRPFRSAQFLKLALLAALTQATFLSVCFTYPLQTAQLAAISRSRPHSDFASPAAGIVGAVGVGLLLVFSLLLLLSIAFLYLACRARATLFDLVVFGKDRVGEAWRRQRAATWRYFGALLLALLLFCIVLAATLGPFVLAMAQTAMTHGPVAARAISSQALVLAGLIWLLLPLWIAVDAILQDFILPTLVIELRDAPPAPVPLRDAFSRFGALLRRSPGQVLLFLILRTVVALAIFLALGLIALVAIGILGLSLYALGKLLYTALWPGGLAAHTVFFTAASAMALLLLVLYLVAVTTIYGISGTFKTSYAAYFFSAHYPELAAFLPQPEIH